MLISEIFDSIDGEGKRAGQLCTFIRVVGCNLRCSYCDTMYAVEPEKYSLIAPKEMCVSDILARVNRRFGRVTITGGEPLLFPETVQLTNRLCDAGYEVNIETNGACDIVAFRELIRDPSRLFFTVDFKLPSSGEMYSMRLSNFESLTERDVLKLVIGTEEDLSVGVSYVRSLLEKYSDKPPIVYFGVVFGAFEMSDVIDEVMEDPKLSDVRFQLQLHKLIWDPNARGV